jgi:sodium/proline symporter
MTTAQTIIILTMAAYMLCMLLIGVIFNRKGASDTSDAFYIGGRGLGPLVTAMSAEASDMSSYLLMGMPGLAYIAGIAEVGWTAIGLAVGTYLNFLFVARLLRRYSERIGAITIPDFFARRYGDGKHTLSLISAIIILVFFIPSPLKTTPDLLMLMVPATL